MGILMLQLRLLKYLGIITQNKVIINLNFTKKPFVVCQRVVDYS